MTSPVILAAARLRAARMMPSPRDAGPVIAAQHHFWSIRPDARRAAVEALERDERRAYSRALAAALAARHAEGADGLARRIEAWHAIAAARGARDARRCFVALSLYVAEQEAEKAAPTPPRRRAGRPRKAA